MSDEWCPVGCIEDDEDGPSGMVVFDGKSRTEVPSNDVTIP